MAKFHVDRQPEVFVSHRSVSREVSHALKQGRVVKIGPRLYSPNTRDPVEDIVRRNRWQIVNLLYPGAVVSHRTAFEGGAAEDGTIFLCGDYSRLLRVPGLTINMRRGPGPLDGDRQFLGDLWIASEARQFLEVLRPSRARATVSRGVTREEVEVRLNKILRTAGDRRLNEIRDVAKVVAPSLDAAHELAVLEQLIGALLGTKDSDLVSPESRARSAGQPYDPERMELFHALFKRLHGDVWPVRPDDLAGPDWRNIAFYDAYFSNYIEGTEFELEEAAEIVFEERVPEHRPRDAHDILNSYRILSRSDVMGQSAAGPDDETAFLDRLRRLHGDMLPQRPGINPGVFKDKVNRVGAREFVHPELVEGTLRQGFGLLRGLEAGLARALFISLLIAEVHPFGDGNGRLARLMMNAELVSAGQRRILVPIGYRKDYLAAMSAFSGCNPGPILETLIRAQRFSAEIDFTIWEEARRILHACEAFDPPEHAHLRMPSGEGLANRDPSTGLVRRI